MSKAIQINEITQKEFQDYWKKQIKNYEYEITKLKVKKETIEAVLWNLDGIKIVEEKK